MGRGLSPKAAKQCIDRLASGETAAVSLPISNADCAEIVQALNDLGVAAAAIRSDPDIDVAALRSRFNLSRAEFGRRFGIEPRTLESWEQGRSAPDKTARTLLQVISVAPEQVTAALYDTAIGDRSQEKIFNP